MRNQGLAERIKTIRLSKGLSQEQFGELFSPVAARSIVSRWESGSSVPSAGRIKKIASLGHISVEELVNGSVNDLIKETSKYIYSVYSKNFDGSDLPQTKLSREIWQKLNTHKDTSNYSDQRLVSAIDIIFTINGDNYDPTSDGFDKNYAFNLKAGLDYCSEQLAKKFKWFSVSNLSVERLLFNFKIEAEHHSYGYTPTNKGLLTAVRDKLNESALDVESIANADIDPTLSDIPEINKDFYKKLIQLIDDTNEKLTELYNKYV